MKFLHDFYYSGDLMRLNDQLIEYGDLLWTVGLMAITAVFGLGVLLIMIAFFSRVLVAMFHDDNTEDEE